MAPRNYKRRRRPGKETPKSAAAVAKRKSKSISTAVALQSELSNPFPALFSPREERSQKRKPPPASPIIRAATTKVAETEAEQHSTKTPPKKKKKKKKAERTERELVPREEAHRKNVGGATINIITAPKSNEAIISGAIDEVNDPYLEMVLGLLLEQYRDTKQKKKTARLSHRCRATEAIFPKNLNPSPLQFEEQAKDFVEHANNHPAVHRVRCIPAAVAGPCRSIVSELTDKNEDRRQQHLKTFLSDHHLIECEEEIPYVIREPNNGKVRTGKRRVRGICRYCKKKTKYYCPTCHGKHGAKRAWFYSGRNGGVCQARHLRQAQEYWQEEF